MIFLTIGTWRTGYDRLVRAIDELIIAGVITEEVIAQTGYSSYQPKNMKVIEFCSPAEFRNLISNARLVISHAGMGTIIETVQQGKPLIAVPRRRSLDEADNDHQFATAKQLEKEGKILVAYDVDKLSDKLKEAETFVPSKGQSSKEIIRTVQEFIDNLNTKKRQFVKSQRADNVVMKLWPYRILKRDEDDLKGDLSNIMQYFMTQGMTFDTIVFIPCAGKYLSQLFVEIYDGSSEINFLAVRRASTVSKNNWLKQIIFKKKWLANIMRHVDVLLRLMRYKLRINQKMVADLAIDFDVRNKKVLVIDDDVATGTTLELVKSALHQYGASSVTTASISNHFLPNKIRTDYSVYRYVLLRTKNSRDYYAS